MKFTKMHALGNDYVVINTFIETIDDIVTFVRKVCDRHFGIGADGVLLVKASDVAEFKMEIYNADGSRAQMCGNGIRCFAKYVYDYNLTTKETFEIETDAGIREVKLHIKNDKIREVTVDMGAPILEPQLIPVIWEKDIVVNEPILVKGKEYQMTCVSMGNPHAVIWVNDVENFPIEVTGMAMEYHARFPERVNTEFVQIINHKTVKMRVWERGVGETLACGTGASAVCVAGVLCGLTDEEVTVKLKRGNLHVRWDRNSNRVMLTGEAVKVFDGVI